MAATADWQPAPWRRQRPSKPVNLAATSLAPIVASPVLYNRSLAQRTTRGGPFEHSEPKCQCPGCRRNFFPQRLPLKLDGHAYSPKVLHKIAETASHVKSFEVVADLLEVNAEMAISSRHVNRLTQMIGQELQVVKSRRTDGRLRASLPPATGSSGAGEGCSERGWRCIYTREPGHGRGVHEPGWREDKVGCLQVLDGPSFAGNNLTPSRRSVFSIPSTSSRW